MMLYNIKATWCQFLQIDAKVAPHTVHLNGVTPLVNFQEYTTKMLLLAISCTSL